MLQYFERIPPISRTLFHWEGISAMTYEPMKKHGYTRYGVWGLMVFVFWLSLCLHAAGLAEGGATETPKESSVFETQTPADVGSAATEAPAVSGGEHGVTKTDVRYAVDFSYLREVAPNSVAWLYQSVTTLNLPVMYSEDDGYYLRRQFNDRISSDGSVFVTGEQAPDFSASVITLYGRNCLDYSMFGSLSNYQDEAYYQANQTLYLLTPEGDYQLDVFAGIRTKLSDEDSWKISAEATAALLPETLAGLLDKSFIQPTASALPEEGDAWAILATESDESQGTRYVIYARKRPIVYATENVAYVNKIEMDSRETLNGYVTVENVGRWMLYAQNDPLWEDLIYESQTSSRRRKFGDGGCGPTAIAMAIVNLVDKEELVKLGDYASSPLGYRFCSSSVNDYWCSGQELTYQITTPDEYLRYFPLAVASFSTGNNIWGVQGRTIRFGTNMRYLEYLCKVFDLSLTQTSHMDETITFLQKGDTIAVACTSGYGSPFTKTSHFLVLAGADDNYLYVLDPLRRDSYGDLDRKGFLEVIVPGLVRIKLENAAQCNISPIYLLERNAAP
jgi:sortase B